MFVGTKDGGPAEVFGRPRAEGSAGTGGQSSQCKKMAYMGRRLSPVRRAMSRRVRLTSRICPDRRQWQAQEGEDSPHGEGSLSEA